MAIYRGPGGSGDATQDASSEALITIQAKDAALAAQAAAEAAQIAAQLAETNAELAETNAELAETNAETAATNAAASASAAATSASNASTSATNAANSATAAQTAETNAETAETNAAASASAASTSASNAATSATNASNSASAAATSATNAANSASAASTSATNAANSATAAQTARTAAELAETNAETAEANAEAAQIAAETAETNAETAATNAANSASAAATSATNASNSASAAATSATNASNSASAASTSASNAAASESNAASSASATASLYDSFDDRYLGAKSSAPSTDNDGDPLLVGALYYDTGSASMKVWNGALWLDAYVSLSGALIANNNLSDLNNAAIARDNLGVEIGVDVQAYDATILKSADIGNTVQGYDADTAKYDDTTANFTGTLQNGGSNVVVDSDIGVTVQSYDADTAKYDDVTANFTGTLQNGGSNVVVDSDIGSTVQAYDADTTKNDVSNTFTQPQIFPAGTVSAPSITTTGDTNTGIFFPAADTIAFTEGGVESMRIDSSGRVGIGTTSLAQKLHLGVNADTVNFLQINASSTTGYYGVDATGIYIGSDTAAKPVRLFTAGSERIRIHSSGGVSIGNTTDPGATNLSVTGTISGNGSSLTALNASQLTTGTVPGDRGVTAGSTSASFVEYNGTTATAGQFDGGTTTPTGTTRLNYGGYFYPTALNLVGTGETTTAANAYFVETSSDGFVRPKTLANVRTEVVTTAAVNAAAATTLGTVTTGVWNASAIPVANGGTGATTAAAALANLGGTTVGINFFDLPNPSAIRFPRINADNTVSALDAASFRTAIGAGTSSTTGTVTSVAAGNGMTFTTITGSGTVTLGTPGTLTNTTTNSLSTNSHTHALTGELVETTTGSAPYYGARAWVNFNGTGTLAIRADVNISSITDHGVGDYTVNFTTDMPDANYVVTAFGDGPTNGQHTLPFLWYVRNTYATTGFALTWFLQGSSTTRADPLYGMAVVHR